MGEAGVQKAGGKQQCAASLIKRKRGAASVIKESATREGCKEKVQEGKRKKRRLVAAAGRGAGGALLRVWVAPGRGDLPVSGGFLDGDPSSRSAPSLRCSSQGICSSTWAPDCEFRERSQLENPAPRPCPGDSPRVPEAFLRWVVAEGPAGRGDGAPFRPRSEVRQRKVRRGSTCARQSGICACGKGQQERKKSRKRPRNAVLSLR